VVEERGDIYSIRPHEIKSEVEGWNTILELAPEGSVITPQDVEEGRIIARLDSATLEETVADRKISLFQAEASLVQAEQNHAIQLKQNESDIAGAQQALRFAWMDAESYLGAELTTRLVHEGIEAVDLTALGRRIAERILTPDPVADRRVDEGPELGGEAQQQLRRLASQVQLAAGEHARAEDTLGWSEQLAPQGYISANELEQDRLQARRRRVQMDSARESLELFLRYTLQKDAEQRLSDYLEAERNMERVRARTRSQSTQSEASLRSRQASYELERERLRKAEDMLAKCAIRAPKPGRIAYGSSTGGSWGRRQVTIEEGASVPENTVIIRIPDVSALSVKLNVSERDIDKVAVGQPAIVTTEAHPDRSLPGQVARISPMASTTNAQLGMDEKVYETEVALLEPPELFIPGMSATARIIVGQLEEVVYMPVQAVIREQGYTVCWVQGTDGPVPLRVRLGLSTGTFVEVKAGVRPGERVYLAPPDEAAEEDLAALITQLKTTAPAMDEMEEEPPGPAAAEPPEPAPEAANPAVDRPAETDLRARMRQLRALTGEERTRKTQELLESLTPEQRSQAEEMLRRMAARPEGRGGRPGPRPEGAGGPQNPQQPAARQEGGDDGAR